jgi:hypothetical protein
MGARARHQPPAFRFEKAALVVRRRRQGSCGSAANQASAAQRGGAPVRAGYQPTYKQASHAFHTLQQAQTRRFAASLPASAYFPIHKQHALAATRVPIRACRWPPLPYRGPLAHPRLALCPLHRSRQIREAGRRWRPSCCVRRAPVRASTATPRGHPGRFGCLLVDLRAVVCGALRGAAAVARESVPRACSSGNVRVENVAGGGWRVRCVSVVYGHARVLFWTSIRVHMKV